MWGPLILLLIISQILTVLIGAAVFYLLLRSNRNQEAQQNVFLLSLLVCMMGLLVPDALVLFPFVWWAVFGLRASNLRTYSASAIAIITVVIYAALAWVVWPSSLPVTYVQQIWTEAIFNRQFGWLVLPLEVQIVSAVFVAIGLWALIAHLQRYSRANVRTQTRVLLASPVFGISLVSTIYPSQSGYSLVGLLWASVVYLTVLYLTTYGFPRVNLRTSRGQTTRRLSRRADSRNRSTFLRKKSSVYGSSRRSFSRSSRRSSGIHRR